MTDFNTLNNFVNASCIDSTLKCNYIEPSNSNFLDNKINPKTGKQYTKEEKDIISNTYKNICSSKGGNVELCCSRKFKSQNLITVDYIKNFNEKYVKHRINWKDKDNNVIENIVLFCVLVNC